MHSCGEFGNCRDETLMLIAKEIFAFDIVIINTISKIRLEKYNCISTQKVVITIISYEPMWETMKRKNISQYRLLKQGIDNKTLDTLKSNGNITVRTLETICRILDCKVSDVITFTDREKEEGPPGQQDFRD